jgi:hypothetical protein
MAALAFPGGFGEWVDLGEGSLFARTGNRGLRIESHKQCRKDISQQGKAFLFHNTFVAPRGGNLTQQHVLHFILPPCGSFDRVDLGHTKLNVAAIAPFKRETFLSLTIVFIGTIDVTIRFRILSTRAFGKLGMDELLESSKSALREDGSSRVRSASDVIELLRKSADVGDLLRKAILGV